MSTTAIAPRVTCPRAAAPVAPTRAWLRSPWLHAGALALLSTVVFQDGLSHSFTNWDDIPYIVDNPIVHGLSWDHLTQVFSGFHLGNYNPLQLVSYMIDYEVWGLKAGGFFATNLLIHTASGTLLYLLLSRVLASPSAGLLGAAVFLLHPTRVESVAWLSERKDVLSGLFGLGCLLVYRTRLEEESRSGAAWRGRALAAYAASVALFLLALLSKSQLLGLPLVLLGLRLAAGQTQSGPGARKPPDASRPRRAAAALRGVLELAPFLALSALFAGITLCAHGAGASRGVLFPESLTHPLAALPRYLLHSFLPLGLSPYYDPFTQEFATPLAVALGACVLAGLGALAAWAWRRDRTALLGIVWFAAFLSPVLGIVQTQIQLADRYLYLALAGLFITVARLCARTRAPAPALAGAGIAITLAMAATTYGYVPVFRSSEALWTRVLLEDPLCSMANSSLGYQHLLGGRMDEARTLFDADLSQKPYFEPSLRGRALLYELEGQATEARRLYELLVEKRPQSVLARTEFAEFLAQSGQLEEAARVLGGLEPRNADATYYQKLSSIEARRGRVQEALEAARNAVSFDPSSPEAWQALGVAQGAAGDKEGADLSFREALRRIESP